MEHHIILLNNSAISVAKPSLSSISVPTSPCSASACICCQGRCSRFTEGWCQAVIIPLHPLQNLKWGQLWIHCCPRDVSGFGLFPWNPCLCISFLPLFLTQPSVSPCVSVLSALCWQAARSYGRRRGKVWHFLWGSVLPCWPRLSPRLRGVLLRGHYLLFICAVIEWNHINFDTDFPCCAFNQYGTRTHQICLHESCFARWWKGKKKNLSAKFLFSLFWVNVLPVIPNEHIRHVAYQMHPTVKSV